MNLQSANGYVQNEPPASAKMHLFNKVCSNFECKPLSLVANHEDKIISASSEQRNHWTIAERKFVPNIFKPSASLEPSSPLDFVSRPDDYQFSRQTEDIRREQRREEEHSASPEHALEYADQHGEQPSSDYTSKTISQRPSLVTTTGQERSYLSKSRQNCFLSRDSEGSLSKQSESYSVRQPRHQLFADNDSLESNRRQPPANKSSVSVQP